MSHPTATCWIFCVIPKPVTRTSHRSHMRLHLHECRTVVLPSAYSIPALFGLCSFKRGSSSRVGRCLATQKRVHRDLVHATAARACNTHLKLPLGSRT